MKKSQYYLFPLLCVLATQRPIGARAQLGKEALSNLRDGTDLEFQGLLLPSRPASKERKKKP